MRYTLYPVQYRNKSIFRKTRNRVSLMPASSLLHKHIHIIWIGDETKTPLHTIRTWAEQNPSWTLHLWGNQHMAECDWTNQKHIDTFLAEKNMHYLSGIADIMRYEILYACGGFYVDADALCTRPLEDWLFDSSFCASWENEHARPGLIANTYMYSTPQNPLLLDIIHTIHNTSHITADNVWKMTGPAVLTNNFHRTDCTIWPSHYFIPSHFEGPNYQGNGHVFARHEWSSTHDLLRLRAQRRAQGLPVTF